MRGDIYVRGYICVGGDICDGMYMWVGDICVGVVTTAQPSHDAGVSERKETQGTQERTHLFDDGGWHPQHRSTTTTTTTTATASTTTTTATTTEEDEKCVCERGGEGGVTRRDEREDEGVLARGEMCEKRE